MNGIQRRLKKERTVFLRQQLQIEGRRRQRERRLVLDRIFFAMRDRCCGALPFWKAWRGDAGKKSSPWRFEPSQEWGESPMTTTPLADILALMAELDKLGTRIG